MNASRLLQHLYLLVLAAIHPPAERVQEYASRSKSAATIKAYGSGWREFLDFCADHLEPGALRSRGRPPHRRHRPAWQSPALVANLKKMLEKLPATRVALRDRAVLLLGFAGAFRSTSPISSSPAPG